LSPPKHDPKRDPRLSFVRKLAPRHFKVLDLCLEGKLASEIAKELGMKPETVGNIIRSPTFQDRLARSKSEKAHQEINLRQEKLVRARGILEEGATIAAEAQVGLLKSDDDRIKLQASQAILDRVFDGDEKDPGTGLIINTESVQLLQVAIQESRKPLREIDVTVEGVEVES